MAGGMRLYTRSADIYKPSRRMGRIFVIVSRGTKRRVREKINLGLGLRGWDEGGQSKRKWQRMSLGN